MKANPPFPKGVRINMPASKGNETGTRALRQLPRFNAFAIESVYVSSFIYYLILV